MNLPFHLENTKGSQVSNFIMPFKGQTNISNIFMPFQLVFLDSLILQDHYHKNTQTFVHQ